MAIVLVTGANRGTGLEYCRQLQARIEVGVEVSSAESDADLLGRLAGLLIDLLR
jgi:NAD(P)-dependent dehydrogenase (short-subunit alcohol dehydrogenase family)